MSVPGRVSESESISTQDILSRYPGYGKSQGRNSARYSPIHMRCLYTLPDKSRTSPSPISRIGSVALHSRCAVLPATRRHHGPHCQPTWPAWTTADSRQQPTGEQPATATNNQQTASKQPSLPRSRHLGRSPRACMLSRSLVDAYLLMDARILLCACTGVVRASLVPVRGLVAATSGSLAERRPSRRSGRLASVHLWTVGHTVPGVHVCGWPPPPTVVQS